MSTFDKTNNVESDKELLEDINVQDEDKEKIQDEVDEDGITELEGKMKNQIVKDEEEAYTFIVNMHIPKVLVYERINNIIFKVVQ
ncbi:hypothetical protein P3L10_009847 [Capsicum annuum]